MPDEKSKLLNNNNNNNNNGKKGSNSQLHSTLNEDSASFINPRTGEQKIFVGFLAFLIVCLVALSVVVIFDSSSSGSSNDSRLIRRDDLAAKGGLDLLNSLYRQGSTLQPGCESTLLLMRHCDKTTDADGVTHHGGNSYCSWVGQERSYFLASLFDPNNPHRRWPAPSKLFALTVEREEDDNEHLREIETLMPLAHKFGLEIDVYPADGSVLAADYFELLQSGEMCGKVTVVSWKHDLIPDLAFALACGPAEGCPYSYPEDTYDEVWQLKFVFDPQGKSILAKTAPMDLPVATQGPLSLYEPNIADLPVNALDDDDDDDDDYTSKKDGTTTSTTTPSSSSASPPEPTAPDGRLRHRLLKKVKKVKHKKKPRDDGRVKRWVVYGLKTFQNFDPLHYSFLVGDYPPEGIPSGGRWADEM